MRVSFAFALTLLAAGCFTPSLGDGAVACGTSGACPPKYFCHSADNHCWKTPDSPGGDGDLGSGDTFDFAGGDFAACMRAVCGPQSCGVIADNCGSVIDCGNLCSTGRSCGGGGTPHQCGCPTQVQCGNRNCGTMPDGCGGVESCGGACPGGQSCGGGGGGSHMANVCSGGPTCTPKVCQMDKDCGLISDGCAAVLDCKTCPSNKTCGTDHMCH